MSLSRHTPNLSSTKHGSGGPKCSRAPFPTPPQEQKRPLTPQIAREHFGKHYTNTNQHQPTPKTPITTPKRVSKWPFSLVWTPKRPFSCSSCHFPKFGHQNRHFRAQVAILPSLDTKTAFSVLKWQFSKVWTPERPFPCSSGSFPRFGHQKGRFGAQVNC